MRLSEPILIISSLAEDLFHPDIGIVVGYKITVVPLTIAAVAASLIPLK